VFSSRPIRLASCKRLECTRLVQDSQLYGALVDVDAQKGGDAASPQGPWINLVRVDCVTDCSESPSRCITDEGRCNHTQRVVVEVFVQCCVGRLPVLQQVLDTMENGSTCASEKSQLRPCEMTSP
jgi:hypothetical protein